MSKNETLNLEVFDNPEFGRMRILREGSKYLFCASDAASALGYVNPRSALQRHCKDVVKRDTQTPGGVQSLSYIAEGDLYRLIIHSKLPSAEKFEHWVFEEVLPCIRKTGGYMSDNLINELMNEPDIIYRINSDMLKERGQRMRLESEAKAAKPKYASVKGKDQQRFIRFHSLGEGYSEEDIQAVIAGEKKHRARIKSPLAKEDRVFNLLLIIDDKIRAKGPGYQQWATNYNLKQMAKTRIFLKEHNINSMDELREKASSTSADFDRIDKELKSAEQRLVEIAALKKHIINYAKTREVYVQYRKAGYSKVFFEAHREEITLHKAAKDAFQKMGVSKLPKVKELSEEYATVLEQKKSLYAQYRLAREEMREYQKGKRKTSPRLESRVRA